MAQGRGVCEESAVLVIKDEDGQVGVGLGELGVELGVEGAVDGGPERGTTREDRVDVLGR